MEDDDKEDVKQLLQYNPETAGGIMTTEYLDIHANNTVKETLLFLQTTVHRYPKQQLQYHYKVPRK